jgi:hypothetical protein
VICALALLGTTGCARWSTSSVDSSEAATQATTVQPRKPYEVQLSECDIAGRRYTSLGEISVTVNKTTLFHADPTRERANWKLK